MKYKLKRLSEIGDYVSGIGDNLINANTFDTMVKIGQNLSLTELLGHKDMSVGLFFKYLGAKCAQFVKWIPGGESFFKGISSWWQDLMTKGWGATDSLGRGMIVIAILAGLAIIFWVILKAFRWIRRKISGTRQNYSEVSVSKIFSPKVWAKNCEFYARKVAEQLPLFSKNTNVTRNVTDVLNAFNMVKSNPQSIEAKFTTTSNLRSANIQKRAESVTRYIWKNTSLNVNECAKIYNYLRG